MTVNNTQKDSNANQQTGSSIIDENDSVSEKDNDDNTVNTTEVTKPNESTGYLPQPSSEAGLQIDKSVIAVSDMEAEEDGKEEDDKEEEAEDDDDDDDDEPPLLKYTRINQLPKNFFQRDSISSCLFGDHFFAFGTHSGILHLTTCTFEPIKTIKCHRSSILCINTDGKHFATGSIDGTVIIGSIDDPQNITQFDFKRPINSVALHSNYQASKMFVSGGMAGDVVLSQRNWLGNRIDIILNKKKKKKIKKDNQQPDMKGPIMGIYTMGDLILWMDDDGVTFCDIPTRSELLNISFPTQIFNIQNVRPDLFRPHVHFLESDRIIIGWGSNIWLFKVSFAKDSHSNKSSDSTSQSNNMSHFNPTTNFGSLLSSAASSFRGTPDKKVELERHFTVSMLIAGLASFKDDQLLCLGFDLDIQDCTDDNGNNNSNLGNQSKNLLFKGKAPELKIVDLFNGDEIYNDEVIMKNYEKLSLNDYHLGKHIDETTPEYYLISSNDAIRVQELSLRDHFDWFIERKQFYKAWKIGKYVIGSDERFSIGLKFFNTLVTKKDWSTLIDHLNIIFEETLSSLDSNSYETSNKVLLQWADIIEVLIKSGKIVEIAPLIPEKPVLRKSVYDDVLHHFLVNGMINKFHEYIIKWDLKLFSVAHFEEELETKIETANEPTVLHDEVDSDITYRTELVLLYLKENKYTKAIPHLLKAKDLRALAIIKSQNLLPQYLDQIVDIILLPYKGKVSHIPKLSIFEIQTIFNKPIDLLFENRHTIPIDRIYKIFEHDCPKDFDKILFSYLIKFLDTDDSFIINPYENQLIELYSEYDPQSLLPFLQKHSNYNVETAIEVCSSKPGLYNELIYLWGKIGETKKALSLIIDELQNPQLAIDFVRNWGDSDLWEFMINYSLDKPNFTRAILTCSDETSEIYLKVIRGMSNDLKIDNLQDIIRHIVQENSLSLKVRDNILVIINDETNKFANEFLKIRSQGKLFQVDESDGEINDDLYNVF
ncbi:Vacuolar protein sorting-associated protein 41 [Saccharomyces pastorianus]|uniref:Vacuolar protein sorting-associated protein 41 n=1 Tax=Saccharomyces pastorianus TaxID=27292 RepID=A0A6C1E4G8_SACPS|nr:Vacuolar protein sorting-associated protein 41 [Saccharomyces pastorianus]